MLPGDHPVFQIYLIRYKMEKIEVSKLLTTIVVCMFVCRRGKLKWDVESHDQYIINR